MNKAYLILGVLGLGGVGYLIYKKMNENSQTNYSPYSYPNNAYVSGVSGAQPSEQYPYRAIVAPRVDNSNQPWSATSNQNVSNAASSKASGSVLTGFTQDFSSAASVVSSAKSIWDDLGVSDWFSDGGSAVSQDNSSDSFDWGSLF